MRSRDEAVLNFATYALGRVVSLLVFGTTVPLALKAFGVESYAVFSALVLVIGYVPIMDVGIGYALTYRYSRLVQRGVNSNATTFLWEHQWIYLGLAGILALLFLTAFPWLFIGHEAVRHEVFSVAAWGALATLFVCLASIGRGILIGHRRTHILNLLDIATDLFRGGAIYIGAVLLGSLSWTAGLTALAYGLRLAAILLFGKRYGGHPDGIIGIGAVRLRSLRASLSLGGPIAITTAATIAFGFIDKAIIARQLPLAELTAYSLAYDIVVRGWMVVWAINGALSPIMLRWKHSGMTEHLRRALRYSLVVAVVIAVAIYVPLNVVESKLLGWWVGDAMARNVQVQLLLLSAASVFYLVSDVLQNYFRANGNTSLLAKTYSFAFLIYIPCLLYGIDRMQTIGAAIAQIILWATVACILLFRCARMSVQQILKSPIPAQKDPAVSL